LCDADQYQHAYADFYRNAGADIDRNFHFDGDADEYFDIHGNKYCDANLDDIVYEYGNADGNGYAIMPDDSL
jgi:hypothetical protein